MGAGSIGSRTGSITLDGGDEGAVRVSGRIDASGRSLSETGGDVALTGEIVELTSTARLDASGDAGGGTALIGGDYRGGGDLRAAETTRVAKGALIRVDALSAGDGGKERAVGVSFQEGARDAGHGKARGRGLCE